MTKPLTNDDYKNLLEILDEIIFTPSIHPLKPFYSAIKESIELRIKECPTRYEAYPEDCDCPNCMSNIAGYKGYVNNCPFCGKEIDWSEVKIIGGGSL